MEMKCCTKMQLLSLSMVSYCQFHLNESINFCFCSDVLLINRVYNTCVWSRMLHGGETWSSKRKNELALYRTEMRMIR